MIDKGYIVHDGGRYEWQVDHSDRPTPRGIDGGKVNRVSVVKDGSLYGVTSRDYLGAPRDKFTGTLIAALIERFEE